MPLASEKRGGAAFGLDGRDDIDDAAAGLDGMGTESSGAVIACCHCSGCDPGVGSGAKTSSGAGAP